MKEKVKKRRDTCIYGMGFFFQFDLYGELVIKIKEWLRDLKREVSKYIR